MNYKWNIYDDFDLWDAAAWQGRISAVDGIVRHLGAVNCIPSAIQPPELSPEHYCQYYSGKVGALLLPEFFRDWQRRGVLLRCLDMTEHWMAALPLDAVPKGQKRYPVLVVFTQGDYDDACWPMNLALRYESYLEMAARDGWIVIFILSNKQPDVDGTYVNILQEAGALFPCNMSMLWLDVSGSVQELSGLPHGALHDCRGAAAAPADLLEEVTSLHIPALYLPGNWEYRGSLSRDLVMTDKYSLGNFDRARMLHSETGRKMMEGIRLEHCFDSLNSPGFAEHFRHMGLQLDVHETAGERWLTLTPMDALDAPTEKLPLVCIMQEVYRGNEHLAVTALSYFYEFARIASNGACMLLFFVLEDPDSNDLLAELIDEAVSAYPADASRVYVTGHSHDGRFALEFAARNWCKIAAVATLGNFCGLEDAGRLGSAGVTQERAAQLQSISLPLANFCGCCEHGGKLPVNVDARCLPLRPGQEFGRTLTLDDRIRAWQRRLVAWNCPVRSREEILTARCSQDQVERELGFPVDRSSIRVLDGFRHYVGDIKDNRGRYMLRMVGHENMPHVPVPAMLTLAWEFLSRFARDTNTAETIELQEGEQKWNIPISAEPD